MNWSWLLPESVSTFGADIDRLYMVILWITGVTFVVTEAMLVFFVVKYRRPITHTGTRVSRSSGPW